MNIDQKSLILGGIMTLRWFRESNGYYSEEVDCVLYDAHSNEVASL